MKVLFFDLETRKLAQDLRPDDHEAGWEALRNGEGGISALVIYDSEERWPYIYDDLTIEAAVRHLELADILVGFRIEKFDIPVVEGVLGRKLRCRQVYDIYTEIVQHNARKGIIGRKGDFTLDAISTRTLGKGKIGHGSHATELIRDGRFAELFNYCSNDVKLTYELMVYICEHGGVMNINNSFLGLTVPEWIKREIKEH